ncbi:helix-turn-helix domain-containing protein [Verticiella sediminum]|nr:helix-turn-helix domain-containing protein [Verticiella sediminum]
MQQWRLSTEDHYISDREGLWRRTLLQICLPPPTSMQGAAFFGDVVNVVSPMGIEFSRVHSTAQMLSGACRQHPDALWLALLLDGDTRGDEGAADELAGDDILYGPTGVDSTLCLYSDFSLLYVKIPRRLLQSRLVNVALLGGVGRLPGANPAVRMLAALLRALAEGIESMDERSIHPAEAALIEFVVACLGDTAAGFPGTSPSRAVHFHQVCQYIEIHLGDGDLSLTSVAAQQRASSRYIQKLFEEAGLSFGHYVRERRLERCYRELANPLNRRLSISEICFRWGFNDAAHFSRSFNQRFGLSPRAFRQRAETGTHDSRLDGPVSALAPAIA